MKNIFTQLMFNWKLFPWGNSTNYKITTFLCIAMRDRKNRLDKLDFKWMRDFDI